MSILDLQAVYLVPCQAASITASFSFILSDTIILITLPLTILSVPVNMCFKVFPNLPTLLLLPKTKFT